MIRFSIPAVLACCSLAILPLNPAAAATKKSSASAKKKSTTSTAKKKAAPAKDGGSESASSDTKAGATPPLDLPLPAKKEAGGEAASDAEAKNSSKPATNAKTAEKPATDTAVKREHAPNATVEPENIAEFSTQSPRVQQLIRDAVDLTRLNLTYTFGSADPDNGGMDCSGTIYYLLKAHGFDDVARDSSGQYLWSRKSGMSYPVVSKDPESVELKELLPGDLMFWTGTYETERDIPISHVMLYLGREKATGKRIMFGASNGRSYDGVARWGVSIFDFKMPKSDAENPEKAKVDFVGYARIPGLRSPSVLTAGEQSPPPASEDAAKDSAKYSTNPSKSKTTSSKSKTTSLKSKKRK